MYRITFYNNEIDKKEGFIWSTFKEALKQYLEILEMPWWDVDISDLKILKNGKDITKKVNKILERK